MLHPWVPTALLIPLHLLPLHLTPLHPVPPRPADPGPRATTITSATLLRVLSVTATPQRSRSGSRPTPCRKATARGASSGWTALWSWWPTPTAPPTCLTPAAGSFPP